MMRWRARSRQHLPKHIPGNPTVVVKNMAGAGGIVAANFLYNVAPKDGLTIGGLQNNVPFEPLLRHQGSQFRSDQIHLARHAQPGNRHPHRLAHRAGRQLAAGQDHRADHGIVRQQFDAEFLRRGCLNEVLGLKLKIIVGYELQTHAFLAMERGEINGYPSVFYNSLMATKPTWLQEKKVKLLVQMGGREGAGNRRRALPGRPDHQGRRQGAGGRRRSRRWQRAGPI